MAAELEAPAMEPAKFGIAADNHGALAGSKRRMEADAGH
jgi:hypothetical protein